MANEEAVEFVYELGGSIEEIDVNELAPCLLSLGELIQRGNQIVNPGGPRIGVNVKPFRSGSFIVDLVVYAETVQRILDFASSPQALEVKTALEWIGLIGSPVVSAIAAIKMLRGKPKAIEKVAPDQVRYTSYDDHSFTVNNTVHQILQDNSIHNTLIKVYVQPLERPDVSHVKTYLRGDSDEVLVPKSERESIRAFATNNEPPEEQTKEVTHPGVFLNPKRGSFDGDPKDWSFHRGEEIIVATIKDKSFLEKCATGEYRLNHSDLLTVDLVEKQKVVGTRVQKPTYEIAKVTSYVKGDDATPSASQMSAGQP